MKVGLLLSVVPSSEEAKSDNTRPVSSRNFQMAILHNVITKTALTSDPRGKGARILVRTLNCRVSLAPTWGSLLFLPHVLEASSSGQNMFRSNLGHCSAPKKLSKELDSKPSLGCIYFQLKEDSWFCELRGYHNYCELGESGRMFTWAFYTLLWTISSLSYTSLNTFIIAFPVMSCKTF